MRAKVTGASSQQHSTDRLFYSRIITSPALDRELEWNDINWQRGMTIKTHNSFIFVPYYSSLVDLFTSSLLLKQGRSRPLVAAGRARSSHRHHQVSTLRISM